jgi:type I restriction enzyme S subunit
VLLQDFLPFFLQSETFFQRAMQISVGSLSPTINWRTLARQEFVIPPLDEQRRIADILWEADDVVGKMEECVENAIALKKALFAGWLEEGVPSKASCPGNRWQRVRLGKLMTSSPDGGYSAVQAGYVTGHFVLVLSALSQTGYQPGHLKPVELIPEVEAARLRKGDLLISRSNTLELVGLVGIFDEGRDDISFPDTMMRLNLDEGRVDKRFLEQVLLSRYGRRQIRRIAAGTSGSMKKINRRELSRVPIPLPSLDVQRSMLAQLEVVSKTVYTVQQNLENRRDLKKTLLKELL